MKSNVSFTHANIGTGNSISVLELAKVMINESGLNLEPSMSEALEGDIEKSQADVTLAKREFGWEPKMKLLNWLKEVL